MNVALKSIGVNKVRVIKMLREITNLSLSEAKTIVDGVEAGNGCIITDIQETDVQIIIEKFTQIGAVAEVENNIHENNEKFTYISAIAEIENVTKDEDGNVPDESDKEGKSEKVVNKLLEKFVEFLGWLIGYHEKSLKENKFPTILLIIVEIAFALWLLFKTWKVLLVILLIVSIVLPFIMKSSFSDKDRQDSKEMLISFAKVIVGALIIAVIVFNWNSIINIWRPGAGVRDAYLSQYSENVTIEDAFGGYFDNGKWDTYKENGYTYVLFSGVCEYLGKRADIRITFKITGENFIVDTLEINGQTQNNFIMKSMLSSIYEDY